MLEWLYVCANEPGFENIAPHKPFFTAAAARRASKNELVLLFANILEGMQNGEL